VDREEIVKIRRVHYAV